MRTVPARMLAAALLGLAVSPAFYIVAGVPFQLSSPAAGIAATVLVAVASGYLLVRWLVSEARDHVALVILECGALLTVLAFTTLCSQLVFIGSSRRVGFLFAVLATAWVVCLPVMFSRRTVLERRLSTLPFGASVGVLTVVLLVVGVFVYQFLSRPEHLI